MYDAHVHLSCPGLASSGWSGRRASRDCHCGEPAAQPAKPCGLAVAAEEKEEEKEEEEDGRNSITHYTLEGSTSEESTCTCTSEVSTYMYIQCMYVHQR